MNKSLFLLLRFYIFWIHSHITADPEIFCREILDVLMCLRSLSIQTDVLERLNFQKSTLPLPQARQPKSTARSFWRCPRFQHSSLFQEIKHCILCSQFVIESLVPENHISWRTAWSLGKSSPGGMWESQRDWQTFHTQQIFMYFQIFQRLLVMLRSCENI